MHPLCYKLIYENYADYGGFPEQIEAQVLEINHSIADIDHNEFAKLRELHHLPDGAPYSFVELDMHSLVSP